ncbi:MAG: tRNA pseudouridine(55) synthase TruB [Actinomycetota bacterium]|nr:tRNA pseudouridine(55) synthase TruB [Actinomycetota bacterium]
MDGILIINKPSGPTSHDIVDIIRKVSGIKKVGHAGTLDPMATGVLVILLGKATKIVRFLEIEPKEYIAEALFGIDTDTQDITGNIIKESNAIISINDLKAVMPKFIGDILQIPPMVSAVKVGGVPLYKLARKGKIVERPERKVRIYSLELSEFFVADGKSHAIFKVVCSGGTYIRTLVHDIGSKLGVGATLKSLKRTKVGIFSISDSINVENLTQNRIKEHLISLDKSLKHLPEAVVIDEVVRLVLNGQEVAEQEIEPYSISKMPSPGGFVRIKNRAGALLAIGIRKSNNGLIIKPEVVFY